MWLFAIKKNAASRVDISKHRISWEKTNEKSNIIQIDRCLLVSKKNESDLFTGDRSAADLYFLGLCYEIGDYVMSNLTEALRLYDLAASGGYTSAIAASARTKKILFDSIFHTTVTSRTRFEASKNISTNIPRITDETNAVPTLAIKSNSKFDMKLETTPATESLVKSTWKSSFRNRTSWQSMCQPVVRRISRIHELERIDHRKPMLYTCGCNTGLGDRWRGIVRFAMYALIHERPFGMEVSSELQESLVGVEPSIQNWRQRWQDFTKLNYEELVSAGEIVVETKGSSWEISAAQNLSQYILTHSYPIGNGAVGTLMSLLNMSNNRADELLLNFCVIRSLIQPNEGRSYSYRYP